MADNDKSHDLHFAVGELTAHIKLTQDSINRQTNSIEKLSVEVHQLSSKHSKLEHGLMKANEDIISIRDNMVTDEKLRNYGLRSDDQVEHKKDIEYLRKSRSKYERTRPFIFNAKRGIITAIASIIVTALWAIAKDHWH